MFGNRPTDLPRSEKEICSEQICLLPARETWQCALIQAAIPFSCAAGSAAMTIARQAWFSVICEMVLVFAPNESGVSLYTARLMSEARHATPPLAAQSFFNSRSIFPISTGSPGAKLSTVVGMDDHFARREENVQRP